MAILCLAQAVDQAVKIVIAVEFDFNFTLLPLFLDNNLGAQVTGKTFCEAI
jgi:hypothetical protein